LYADGTVTLLQLNTLRGDDERCDRRLNPTLILHYERD